MDISSGFVSHCLELLSTAGEARSRRMFGGHGLYVDDIFIAIVVGDSLYLKADQQTRGTFEAAGGRRFEYLRAGKKQGAEFWTAPADALDSPALMRPWVQLALRAALGARAGKRRQH